MDNNLPAVNFAEVQVIDPMMSAVSMAISQNVPIEKLQALLAMKERIDAAQARKAFDLAVSEAKSAIPPIIKNREVDFTSSKGRTHYKHEDLAEIARTVDPILGGHGLSYRFRTRQEGQQVYVTCVLSHRDGHSEETTLASAEDHSGNKNAIQAVGSAITYLQRYTLKAALGLAASHDDDAKGAAVGGSISADQFLALRDLLDQSGADEGRFLAHFKIETLDDMPLSRLGEADKMLRAKLAQKGAHA